MPTLSGQKRAAAPEDCEPADADAATSENRRAKTAGFRSARPTPKMSFMLKALFFDAAGTLIFLPKGVASHYREVARRHGMHWEEAAAASAFRAAWQAMPPRAAADAARPDDDRGWWRDLVALVTARCGGDISGARFAEFFQELYARFAEPGVWALYPDVLPVLGELRKNYALGVISNFDGRLRPVLASLGIAGWFQAIVLSSETGADKPHPRIFQRALADLGVAPCEAAHIGNDPAGDWLGAEKAGLHSFPLHRHRNSLHDLPAFLASIAPRREP